MILLIAGSRSLDTQRIDFEIDLAVKRFCETFHIPAFLGRADSIKEIMSGCGPGADMGGERYAERRNLPIIHMPYIPHLGRKGGMIRNAQMARFSDALVAVWDGESPGTKNMIDTMTRQRKPVYVHRPAYLLERKS